jgi:hypothetical protein
VRTTYLIDVNHVIAMVRYQLAAHVGYSVAQVACVDWVITDCTDLVLTGETNSQRGTPSAGLVKMGIPSQLSAGLIEYVCGELERAIRVIELKDPTEYAYEHEIDPSGDLRITIKRKRLSMPNPMNALRENIRVSLENGDWVNEQTRRMLGL